MPPTWLGLGLGLVLGLRRPVRAHACRSATRPRGRTQGRGSAPGRTRAVSACPTRTTGLARSRQRALLCAAAQGQLHLTACDRHGTQRVGRAMRGGTGLWCWAIACGGGPQPKARTSCAGCACAWSCAASHGTVARACWVRQATGATLHRPWSLYATGTGPQRHPRALGRHDEPQSPEPPPRARAAGMFEMGDKQCT